MLTGCDRIVLVPGRSSGQVSEPDLSVSEQLVSSEQELSAYPVVLNGTEITGEINSVVSLTPAYTEILYEMGVGDRLTAVSNYCDYPEQAQKLPKVSSGTSPDIAAISELKPDLIITATPLVTKDKTDLEAEGIKILTITAPKTVEEFENVYKLIGLAFNGLFTGEEKGEQCFKPLADAFAKAKKAERKSFVYITAALSPAGGDTFESSVLSLFGENCAKDGTAYDFDINKLIDNQPDVIFLNDNFSIEDLQSNEVYSQLSAVKNGDVIPISNLYFERPTARMVELIELITDKFGISPEATEVPEAESNDPTPTEEPADTTSRPDGSAE